MLQISHGRRQLQEAWVTQWIWDLIPNAVVVKSISKWCISNADGTEDDPVRSGQRWRLEQDKSSYSWTFQLDTFNVRMMLLL